MTHYLRISLVQDGTKLTVTTHGFATGTGPALLGKWEDQFELIIRDGAELERHNVWLRRTIHAVASAIHDRAYEREHDEPTEPRRYHHAPVEPAERPDLMS